MKYYKAKDLIEIMNCDESFGNQVRVCSECGKLMQDGYIVYGIEYYCDENCLKENISWSEYLMDYLLMDEDECRARAAEHLIDWDNITENQKVAFLQLLDNENPNDWRSDDTYWTEWFEDDDITELVNELSCMELDWRSDAEVTGTIYDGILIIPAGELYEYICTHLGEKVKALAFDAECQPYIFYFDGKETRRCERTKSLISAIEALKSIDITA